MKNNIRKYIKNEVAHFRKTKDTHGGLSNMCAGFPLMVNNCSILTSEAIYQACRFPHLPEVQEEIINQKSPMTAKMKSKPHRKNTRGDWDDVRLKIMRWSIRIKLAQNFLNFGLILEKTYPFSIVENSKKDAFWGAKPDKENDNLLIGVNALGRLLMELRADYMSEKRYNLLVVKPVDIPLFNLFGQPIKIIDERENFLQQLAHKINLNSNVFELQNNFKNNDQSNIFFNEPIIKNPVIQKTLFD